MLSAGNTNLQETATKMDAVRSKIADLLKKLAASQNKERELQDEPVAKKNKQWQYQYVTFDHLLLVCVGLLFVFVCSYWQVIF